MKIYYDTEGKEKIENFGICLPKKKNSSSKTFFLPEARSQTLNSEGTERINFFVKGWWWCISTKCYNQENTGPRCLLCEVMGCVASLL